MDWSFYNYLMSLFLVIFSALKYTDTSTVAPAFLSLMFPWYIFFHLFIFYLLISLYLKWFYCYQHIVGSYFLMQYVSLHCLTGIFRLFKFVYYWWDLALACHFVFICFFYFFCLFVCLFLCFLPKSSCGLLEHILEFNFDIPIVF